jgi:hypothetical protein
MDNAPPDGENDENGGGYNLATFSKAISVLCDASDKLNNQNIKTPAAIKVKTEVLKDLNEGIELVRMLRNIFSANAIAGLDTIRAQMTELKASMEEVKKATKAKPTPWATAASISKPDPDPKTALIRGQKTANRQERAKHEVTLTATTEQTKKKIADMSYKDITKRIQATINTNVHCDKKPTLLGVIKTAKDSNVRIRCETEDEAKMLREINWETAFEGLQARKPKFGIVIHAVHKDDFNILTDANDQATTDRIEKENTLTIVKTAPLRRKDRQGATQHNSIVIFTNDPYAADRCIKRGIYINYRLYPAEKYTPQLQITQCYNCGEYGHRAAQCHEDKQRCGKCAEHSHPTNECKSDGKPKCGNCDGEHEVWHHECKVRIAESRRLHELGGKTPPYFTS